MMNPEQEKYRDEIFMQLQQLANELWMLVQPTQDELDRQQEHYSDYSFLTGLPRIRLPSPVSATSSPLPMQL